MRISKVVARQILDSRGNPTVEADVHLESGTIGRAAVPSGASTGQHEAIELRDNGKAYGGKSVQKAVTNVSTVISQQLSGMLADDQEALDKKLLELDGTSNKSNLGANAMLAVSLAAAHAAANNKNQPLYKHVAELAGTSHFCMPIPMCNVINGGKHATHSSDFQEFMIVPIGLGKYNEGLRACSEVFHALGKLLAEKNLPTTVGDEGGYAPHLLSNTAALDLLVKAIQKAGYKPGQDISIALDVAASELYNGKQYVLQTEDKKLSAQALIDYYKQLIDAYPIISIEDGLHEDDWQGWQLMTRRLGNDSMIVGDDLLVTNPKRIQQAQEQQAANAALIKPNQIGTLTETIKAVKTAHSHNWSTIMSHRSGETEDTTIAHLAVGLHTPLIKTGSMSRSERLAKYNELLRIAEELPNGHTFCEL